MNFENLFNSFGNIKVGVVGDVMLDTYWWGNVERISPEAPVPVVAIKSKELRLGGAANVCLNLVSLKAQTTVLTVLGKDDAALQLKNIFEENNIQTNFIVIDELRPTTNKTRVIARNQQMMRLDEETTKDIATNTEDILLKNIEKYIHTVKPDVIILQDYNKGVLTKNVIEQTIHWCNQLNIITTVDPKKKNFFTYKNATIFKPNLKEIKEGLNVLIEEVNSQTLQQLHLQLEEQLKHKISFFTLSEKGVFYSAEGEQKIIPTHIRNIADVSGAGDTVICVASLVYAATKNMELAAQLANIAGGLVCEEVGTAAINYDKFLNECKQLLA
ncbi:MAG: bifunctional heptose 7-phosphate kinase/heptose 1-phosphate adenyltransferase [Chitinophagaceae bacterium]|jgi:rfaE bifunctional protein kinase chain/domain